ncbi:TaqI-like C-terminal specificity domain-containing protein [Psychrobacter sp. AT9]|uniref:TaqI-like C-terminal specificity domain-containing protein n=1 Tax=Psychrobacter sp. AT9 TaxID=3242893 RepID=UPI0039A5CA38
MRYRKILFKEHLDSLGIKNTESILIPYSNLSGKSWSFGSFDLFNKLKLSKNPYLKLSDYGKAYYGIVTGMDKAFIVNEEVIQENKLETSIIFPFAYKGEEVGRYLNTNPEFSIIYPYEKTDDGSQQLINPEKLQAKFPNTYKYLLRFKDQLEIRKDSRRLYATGNNWFSQVRQGNFDLIKADKLQIRGISHSIRCGFLKKGIAFSGANCPAIILNEGVSYSVIIGIINSSLIDYYLKQICPKKLGGYIRYNTKNISDIPIIYPSEKDLLEFLVNKIMKLREELQLSVEKFSLFIKGNINICSISRKLESWHELSFSDFVKELTKAIKATNKIRTKEGQPPILELTKKDEFEWMELFESKKLEVQQLQQKIKQTEQEIDQMVYQLYDLTADEIAIIEAS